MTDLHKGLSVIKRWPRRRELLTYYLLWRLYQTKEFNLGEAVDVLAPLIGSRNVASRLVRRLVKQGFLERVRPLVYRAKPLEDVLGEAMVIYFRGRLKRRGCLEDEDTAVVECKRCGLDERVSRLLRLKCGEEGR